MNAYFQEPDRARMLPLFWLKGEDERRIRNGVEAVARMGCMGLVAESRTHPDYLGEGWWRDLDIVLFEAKKRGMKVWVLDDTHFPSGYAAGAGANTPYCRMMATEKHMDVMGPMPSGAFVVADDESAYKPGEGVAAVIAAKRLDETNRIESLVDIGGYKLGERVDITQTVRDGMAYWDVPEGIWRVFVITRKYVSERTPPRYFLNPLMPESAQITINTIYNAHYERFNSEFGKTFMGFFSDEPALRAGRGYHAVLGEYPNLPIPWRADMPDILNEALGGRARAMLPGLWYDIGEDTRRVRYALMDAASRLYARNYADPLGEWCRAHGVMYIGHVIEQNNAHCRLGSGAGHFFRATGGLDMAGVDIVLHEVRPEFRGMTHAWHSQDFEADDDFFRYMLMQMAVSSAHIDVKKRGRTLCEIFGAYGWQEDAGEMRYLANMALARGVNYFAPHAFSLAPYPDADSPPHFGDMANPLAPYIKRLFDYMARAGEFIDGGRHICSTAVLYYAEAEWANGTDGCMRTQDVVKALNERQIECEIVPIDMLDEARFELLLVPWARSVPEKLIRRLSAMRSRVRFVGALPSALCEGEGDIGALLEGFEAIPLSSAARVSEALAPMCYRAACHEPRARLYPYQKGKDTRYLIFNEDARNEIVYALEAFDARRAYVLDFERQTCRVAKQTRAERGVIASVRLAPGQMLALLFTDADISADAAPVERAARAYIEPEWRISIKAAGEREFTHLMTTREKVNITSPDVRPRFHGTARYEALINLPERSARIILPATGAVSAWLDGEALGARAAPPYEFDINPAPGERALRVEIVNAPVFAHRDPLSFYACVKPTGILGALEIELAAHADNI